MSTGAGAKRIFLYNWPLYVGTWLAAGATTWAALPAAHTVSWLMLVAAVVAVAWSLVSLGVSYLVYDRSGLTQGAWIRPLLPSRTRTWAAVDAGLDAEVELDANVPGTCVARLDVFDPRLMPAGSLRRARMRTPRATAASACPPTRLALADGSCDVIAVVFTAHEVRDRDARARLFTELHRALCDGGRILLVEHVRDTANFLAFGPGFFHFQTRATWLECAAHARLRLVNEKRVTPWVVVFVLEKPCS